jgi:hypothetical protein
MSENPYLITTGVIFGLGHKLKDSYAFSQVIIIDNLLKRLNDKNLNLFSPDDFQQYLVCKKLIENIQSLMKKKLEVIPEYPMLKSNYMFLSKKIDEHVLSAKEKYDEAIETLNYYIKNKKSGNNSKQSNLFLKEKNNVLNYLNLCVWLELFNDARRTEISQELNKFYDL